MCTILIFKLGKRRGKRRCKAVMLFVFKSIEVVNFFFLKCFFTRDLLILMFVLIFHGLIGIIR